MKNRLNAKEILQHGKLINLVVSTRSYGKTSAFKIEACRRFHEEGKKTIWIRRYKKEYEDLPKFADNFEELGIEDAERYKIKGRKLLYDDDVVIEFKVLSTSLYMKGGDFVDYSLMVFDEFLIMKSNIHYMPNEVFNFLEMINTAMRFRQDFTVVCLGNHISNFNPYYNYFNVNVTEKKEKLVLRDEFLFLFVRNEEFLQEAKQTRLARATKNTPYFDYAFDVDVAVETRNYVKKKSGKCEILCNISHHFQRYTLYYDFDQNCIFLSKYVQNKSVTIHTDSSEGETGSIFFRSKDISGLVSLIRKQASYNAFYTDNPNYGMACVELINLFI